ncbi:MAG: guanylate kinase [Candidatus Fimenecus sp.]
MSEQGKLILFSGPSGVGKDTLLDILIRKNPNFQKSISITTRERREGEVDGVDYYFITPDDFEAMLDFGEVLEFAKYGKNLYGTPKKPVDKWLAEGKSVILKIEVQGAAKIKKMYPDALAIFIMPPSMEILEHRLRQRGTENEDDLVRRLTIARDEIKKSRDYDYIVINDSLEAAADEVLDILSKE